MPRIKRQMAVIIRKRKSTKRLQAWASLILCSNFLFLIINDRHLFLSKEENAISWIVPQHLWWSSLLIAYFSSFWKGMSLSIDVSSFSLLNWSDQEIPADRLKEKKSTIEETMDSGSWKKRSLIAMIMPAIKLFPFLFMSPEESILSCGRSIVCSKMMSDR